MFARTNPGVQLSFIYWWDLLIWISWNAVTCWKVSRFSEVMNSWSFRRFPPPRRSCAIMYAAGPTILGHAHSKMCVGQGWLENLHNVGMWDCSPSRPSKNPSTCGVPSTKICRKFHEVPNSLGSWPSYLGHPWPLFRTAPKRQTTFFGEDLEDWRTRGPLWECSTWCFLPICRSGGRRCSLCHPFGCWTQGTGATARVGAPCPKVWTLAGTGGMC